MSEQAQIDVIQLPQPEKWYTLIMQMSSGEKIITSYEDGSYICAFVRELIGTLLHYPRLMHMAHFARAREFRQIPELAKLTRITFWPTATGPGVMPGDRFFSINKHVIYPFMDPMPSPVPPIVRLVRAINDLVGCAQVRLSEHPEEPTVLWAYVSVPEYARDGPAAWLVADEIDEELLSKSAMSQVAGQLRREEEEGEEEDGTFDIKGDLDSDSDDSFHAKPKRSKQRNTSAPSRKRKYDRPAPKGDSSSPGLPYKKRAKFVK
jgi:hypothetical protein